MRQRQTFERYNVTTNGHRRAQRVREQNLSIGKMISQGRSAFPCNAMQANQGPV